MIISNSCFCYGSPSSDIFRNNFILLATSFVDDPVCPRGINERGKYRISFNLHEGTPRVYRAGCKCNYVSVFGGFFRQDSTNGGEINQTEFFPLKVPAGNEEVQYRGKRSFPKDHSQLLEKKYRVGHVERRCSSGLYGFRDKLKKKLNRERPVYLSVCYTRDEFVRDHGSRPRVFPLPVAFSTHGAVFVHLPLSLMRFNLFRCVV